MRSKRFKFPRFSEPIVAPAKSVIYITFSDHGHSCTPSWDLRHQEAGGYNHLIALVSWNCQKGSVDPEMPVEDIV